VKDFIQIRHVDRPVSREKTAIGDKLHTHDHETLLIGIEGEIIQTVNIIKVRLTAPFISCIPAGTLHHHLFPSEQESKFEIWLIQFSAEFVPEFSFQFFTSCPDKAHLKIPRGPELRRIVSICKMMSEELRKPAPDYPVLHNLLITLLTMVASEGKKQQPPDSPLYHAQGNTFRNFLIILEGRFRTTWGVQNYARELHISPRNLNLLCKAVIRKNAKEIILERKMIEAKRQMLHTDKTISEIGFGLGYQDKTYFTKAFKKKNGRTPSQFREKMKNLLG
jgi:AraC family transcriptional regulator, transcriptional activator of pobA